MCEHDIALKLCENRFKCLKCQMDVSDAPLIIYTENKKGSDLYKMSLAYELFCDMRMYYPLMNDFELVESINKSLNDSLSLKLVK